MQKQINVLGLEAAGYSVVLNDLFLYEVHLNGKRLADLGNFDSRVNAWISADQHHNP